MFHSFRIGSTTHSAANSADAFFSVTTHSFPVADSLVVETDDLPVLIELGTENEIRVNVGTASDFSQYDTLQASRGAQSLKLKAKIPRVSWFEQGAGHVGQSLIKVSVPAKGIRKLRISSKTGSITAIELPETLNKVSVASVTSHTHVRTRAAHIEYKTIVGTAQIELNGAQQNLRVFDVNGCTRIHHSLKALSLQLSTRGDLLAPGYPIKESPSGTKSIEVDGGECASLIEFSSVAGGLTLRTEK